MQTAEQVKQKLYQLEKDYRSERLSLIDEYKRLYPIQVGDKVKVISPKGTVELGQCVGFNTQWGDLSPKIIKLKKDGTVGLIGAIYIYSDSRIEKL